GAGIHLPSMAGRVDPRHVAATAPFDAPGVVPVGPGIYEVRMTSQIWTFTPNEIRVPAGGTATVVAASKDVVHGLFIPQAPVNAMLLPGKVPRVTTRFDTPAEFPIMCHEYCGIAHHTMAGRVIVEPRR